MSGLLPNFGSAFTKSTKNSSMAWFLQLGSKRWTCKIETFGAQNFLELETKTFL